jgi:hypothetical protein
MAVPQSLASRKQFLDCIRKGAFQGKCSKV